MSVPTDEDPSDSGRSRPGEAATIPQQTTGSGRDDHLVAGAVLADRYRVIGLLGKGGMGEVYRADDLKLGQSVALKFLPGHLATDPGRLRRFHDEVRIAREIAHPNVCRTYDIAEFEGEHFITMEYVDGEDLDGLIKRIGRLPKDKALQVSRQLCAGLAAAHDKGVLHRDLKPSNIMLDGRGNVRITDFGLAAIADAIEGADIRAGTPQYMAPEQLAGQAVTVRSDIYSLGLVLYEVFTGRSARYAEGVDPRKSRAGSAPVTPSSLIDDMDPVVERVIMRCLEDDPKDRPGSVIAVATSLPGGDPLAMALAAGETPSPEMVAHAGEVGGLRPPIAVGLFTALVIFTLLAMWLIDRNNVLNDIPMDKPPAVLRDRALTILRDFGYTESPDDIATWFMDDLAPLVYVARNFDRSDPWAPLEGVDLPLLSFDVRTSPKQMVRLSWSGRINWTRPPFDEPGMTRLQLDTRGNLLHFEAVPMPRANQVTEQSVTIDDDPDWSMIFVATGLDQSGFSAIEPDFTPTIHCDRLAAWRGVWPGAPEIPLEVRAGISQGWLAYVDLPAPWVGDQPPPVDATVVNLVTVLILLIGLLFMFRNLRSGRGDRRGAFRLAVFVFSVAMLRWVCTADHVSLGKEFELLFRAFGVSCGLAVLTWAMYLAAEPYARRFWPQSLISWARLLSGRLRDPRVGRDVLIGALTGAATLCVPYAPWGPPPDLDGSIPPDWVSGATDVLLGGRYLPGQLCDVIIGTLPVACGLLVLLLLLRVLLRRTWLAGIALVLVFTLLTMVRWGAFDLLVGMIAIMLGSAFAFIVIRFGLLAVIAMIVAWDGIESFAATFDFDRWYAGQALVGPLFVLAFAAYAFWTSLAGRPIFRDPVTA